MAKTVKTDTIHANGIDIGIYTTDFQNEYVSLTDIAKYRSLEPRITIHNWLRGRDVVEFLGLWEILHNPNFKRIDFDTFKKEAGANAFVFSIKEWVDSLGAIGLLTKSGRYGSGIYAHIDIAFEFASWISPEFKLYIIKDYQRLKRDESSQLSIKWNLNKEISKLNFQIHTEAIKDHLILPELTREQKSYRYASEADLLNMVLFGKTAKQWRDENAGKRGNIRENATLHQLLILANKESYNAVLIKQEKTQEERMQLLHELALQQMQTLKALDLGNLPNIKEGE